MSREASADSTAEKQQAQDFNLEQSLGQLEEIVQTLEDGDLSLEQAMKKFEQGVGLSRACQTALTQAEQRIRELIDDGDSVTLQPFIDDSAG